MLIRLYVIGHLNETFTADDGSTKLPIPPDDDEGDIFGIVPVPHISAGDAVIGSDLTSMLGVLWLLVVLVLGAMNELKFFLTWNSRYIQYI